MNISRNETKLYIIRVVIKVCSVCSHRFLQCTVIKSGSKRKNNIYTKYTFIPNKVVKQCSKIGGTLDVPCVLVFV